MQEHLGLRVWRRAVLWGIETSAYSYLLTHVVPVIRFTTYYTKFPGYKYHVLYDILQPGDIILTTDSKKLTTFLIPGQWSHAAVCVSKDGDFEVAEMTHTDYTKSTFSDVCYESTRVVILRGNKFDKDYTDDFVGMTRGFEGTPYDQKFELGVDALSCSELVYAADHQRRLGASLEDVAGLGRPYISPTGIYNSDVTVIGDSDDMIRVPNGN